MSFVDNFYSFASSAYTAISIMQVFDVFLWQTWGLRFGSKSKEVLDVSRPCIDLEAGEPEYKHVSSMSILGCTVAANGSVEQCYKQTKASMWQAFYSNFGKSLRMTSLQRRLKWLTINILSICACRWCTWPYSHASAKRLDKSQLHMVCLLLDHKMKPGICIDSYYRNRSILAGRTISNLGRWSERWAVAVLRWHHHCLRAHDPNMWHARILSYHNNVWIEEQRQIHGNGKIKRTRTRQCAGKVAQRWSECIDVALEVAPAWTAVNREHE